MVQGCSWSTVKLKMIQLKMIPDMPSNLFNSFYSCERILMLRGPDRLSVFFSNVIILKITCADHVMARHHCYKIVSIESHPTFLNCTDKNSKALSEIYFQI